MRNSAVVLAAGASTRMKQHKLLLPFGGEPLLRRTVGRSSPPGSTTSSSSWASTRGDCWRPSMVWPAGRSSIRTTQREWAARSGRPSGAGRRATAAMFALADQPFVTAEYYRRLLDTYRKRNPPHRLRAVRPGDGAAAPVRPGVFPGIGGAASTARDRCSSDTRDRTTCCSFRRTCWSMSIRPEDYERAKSCAARHGR